MLVTKILSMYSCSEDGTCCDQLFKTDVQLAHIGITTDQRKALVRNMHPLHLAGLVSTRLLGTAFPSSQNYKHNSELDEQSSRE